LNAADKAEYAGWQKLSGYLAAAPDANAGWLLDLLSTNFPDHYVFGTGYEWVP